MSTARKKWLRRCFQLSNLLPNSIRERGVRASIRLPASLSKAFTFKVATSREELEQAFRILHDAYVSSNLMTPDPSGLRLSAFHALPTTTTLVAKCHNRVIATLSIIGPNELGYPMQKIYDISDVVKGGVRTAEISALAVDKKYRNRSGLILFPLLKFMYEYCVRFASIDRLIIAVNPRHIGLYEDLLTFKRLQNATVDHYSFVNGAPAIGAYLDLKEARGDFEKIYDHQPDEKNLFRFFTAKHLPNFIYPFRKTYSVMDPVLTPELLDYFFVKRTQLLNKFTPLEIEKIASAYGSSNFSGVLKNFRSKNIYQGQERTASRFPVCLEGVLKLASPVAVCVTKVSRYGCEIRVPDGAKLPEVARLKVNGPTSSPLELVGTLIRDVETDRVRMIFKLNYLQWGGFIETLAEQVLTAA